MFSDHNLEPFIKDFNILMSKYERISEGSNLRDEDWWQPLLKILEDNHNMHFLGNGHFSGAFTHPSDDSKVVKIGFKLEDSGAAYAAFCRQHQGLYGIPNIYHLERLDRAYIVVLDKLLPYNSHNTDDLSKEYEEIRCILRNGSARSSDLYGNLPPSHPIFETAFRIRHFFSGVASFDLHSKNIMIREEVDGDFKLIITDPVSFTRDEKALVAKEYELGFSRKSARQTTVHVPNKQIKGIKGIRFTNRYKRFD